MEKNSIPEDIHSLQKASQVANTDRSTSNWCRSIERFTKEKGYNIKIEAIDNYEELNKILCEWIAWLKKKNGEQYKAESLFAGYSSIVRYLKEASILQPCNLWDKYRFHEALKTLDGKMKLLQKAGYG